MNPGAQALTMSSREIAELTGKRHDNVMRSIELLVTKGVIRSPQFEETEEINNLGLPRQVQQYCFCGDQGKRDSIVVVAQLSPEFTARLVDRWQELEAQAAPALPNFADPVAAARAWADARELEQKATAALALAAPKAEYVDRYVRAGGAKGFREVAKLLGANEVEFREYLVANKIMYRLGDAWAAYQNHADAGRFVVKTGVAARNEHAFTTTRFTPKGVEWIAGLWGKRSAQLAQVGEARHEYID